LFGVFFVGCAGLEPADDAAATGAATEPTTAVAAQSLTLADRIATCNADPRVLAGLVSVDVCAGADLFLRETFNGNGRSCATCHRVEDNFTIDPAFMTTLPESDPLFVAEVPGSPLAGLEKPALMRQFGLILENVDGFAPDPTTHFVMRSVPHTLSLSTSITRAANDPITTPADRTGWSGDGAPGAGTLRDFQTGAITQHYTKSLNRVAGTDFRLATDDELDKIEAFMRGLGRSNELTLTSVVMSDAGAEAGRAKFLTVGCNACHGNAGANASFGGGGNRNFNTGVEAARTPALAGLPIDGGFLQTPDPTNTIFGNGTFNVPPLVEAADTGPFFHTAVQVTDAAAHNTAFVQTIEEAVAFYGSSGFNTSPAGKVAPIVLAAADIDNIGRFLRGINAAFNIAIASKRLDGVATLIGQFQNQRSDIQNKLIALATKELLDASNDLVRVPSGGAALNRDVQLSLASVEVLLALTELTDSVPARQVAINAARTALTQAAAKLGTNLSFTIGSGSVMF
jgi:mono/diheme cytochrome c family protein